MTGKVEIISRTYRKIKGKYYARVRYKIDDGRPLDILRKVENKSAIKPKQAEIEVELLKHGPSQLVAGKVTFRQLAQHAKDNIYVSAVYDDQETKITGVRSVGPAHAALNNLVAFFGDIDIRKINEKKLTDYQVARLTGTIEKLRKVSLSTVDRELSKARRLFNTVRHNFGTEMANEGMPLPALANPLGEVLIWKPDVIVSDIGLPGENGYELMEKVRAMDEEQGGRTPALALTGYASTVDQARALAAGYQTHLAKPVGIEELAEVVAKLSGRERAFRNDLC